MQARKGYTAAHSRKTRTEVDKKGPSSSLMDGLVPYICGACIENAAAVHFCRRFGHLADAANASNPAFDSCRYSVFVLLNCLEEQRSS